MATLKAIDPQTDSHLAQVPLEVLLRITYFISTADLSNVRLTCKALESALFHFFSHEFFRKKQFMVSSASLQALIDISKHPALSPCLRHVILATDHVLSQSSNHLSPEQCRHLHAGIADQHHLITTGGLRDMLAEAFSNLGNLETIDIRDFNSPTRRRDGQNTKWTSYGATSLARATGVPLSLSPDPMNALINYVFPSAVAALGLAGARPSGLEINLRDARWGLSDKTFYIPPRIEPSVAPVLNALKKLHLCLKWQYGGPDRGEGFLAQFLTLTPNLTWLRLNCQHDMASAWDPFFRWLADPGTTPRPDPDDIAPVRLPLLEQLDLGNVRFESDTLFLVLAKFAPTLRSLSLRRVLLESAMTDARPQRSPWIELFSKLRRLRTANIRKFDLSLLQHQIQPRGDIGNVSFGDASSDPRSAVARVFSGTSTEDAIKQVLARLTAPIPEEESGKARFFFASALAPTGARQILTFCR